MSIQMKNGCLVYYGNLIGYQAKNQTEVTVDPQFRRENWRNLNGTWQFDFDFGASGRDRRFYENPVLTKKIEVPFCPESRLHFCCLW